MVLKNSYCICRILIVFSSEINNEKMKYNYI